MNVARIAESFLDLGFSMRKFLSSLLIRSQNYTRLWIFGSGEHNEYLCTNRRESGFTFILIRTRITFGIRSMRAIKARLSEDSLVALIWSRFNVYVSNTCLREDIKRNAISSRKE